MLPCRAARDFLPLPATKKSFPAEQLKTFHCSHYKNRLTNRGQRDEAEVGRIQEVPALPSRKQERSAEDVADDQEDAQPDGHRLDERPVVLELVVVERVLVHHRCNVARLAVHGETHRGHDSWRRRWNFNFVSKPWRNDDGGRNGEQNKK